MTGLTKLVRLNDPSMNVITVANAAVVGVTVAPTFQNTGMWYEFFTGDSLNVTATSQQITLAAGEYRLYMSRKVVIGTENTTKASPFSLLLFPNPTETKTAIAYNLTQNAAVTVEVFDMLGRKIATLAQNEVQPEGIQTLYYDTSALPQGAYIVRLSANGVQETMKLVKK